MRVHLEEEHSRVTARVQGCLDESCRPLLGCHLDVLAQGDWPEVVLDMGQVTFLGSSAIAGLLRLYRELAGRQASLILDNVPPSMMNLFASLCLDQVFCLRPSQDPE